MIVKLKALQVDAEHLWQLLDCSALDCCNTLAKVFYMVGIVALHQLTLHKTSQQALVGK